MEKENLSPRDLGALLRRVFPDKKFAMQQENYRIERIDVSAAGVDVQVQGPLGPEPLYFSTQARVTTREDKEGIVSVVILDGEDFTGLRRVEKPVPKEEQEIKYEM